jgi:hypothetical protein
MKLLFMKRSVPFIFLIAIIFSLYACGNSTQNEAVRQAKAAQEAIKAHTPGGIPTSDNGNYIKAKFDGKQWSAAYVVPDFSPTSSYQQIIGENGDNGLGFQLWKRGVEIGKKIPFDEDHAANLTVSDFSGYLSGKSGEVVVTKLDDQWIEGTFFFTGTSSNSDKKVEVTDGHFRISLVPDAK